MFNSLFKMAISVFTTIAIIISINFVTNTLMAAEKLDKDAVPIAIEVKEEVKPEEIKESGTAEVVEAAPVPEKAEIPETIIALLASADISKGKKVSKSCAACHTFKKGGKKKIGPNLWNVVGKEKASTEGFSYSKGMKALGGTWDYDSLDQFLLKPKKYVKGTKMGFAGIKKIKDRAALIAWLREQADAPIDLPATE